MVFERKRSSGELIDVLDRVLDKGIVIDASIRVALFGIDLVRMPARKIVVASIETCFRHNELRTVPSLLAGTPVLVGQSASSAEAATISRSRVRSNQRPA